MLTHRQEQILWSLDRLGFLKRSQIQRLHDLKSVRNANDVLRRLKPYVHYVRLEENVYYLNQAGRDYVGSTKERNKTMQMEHVVMRNDMYLHYNCPKDFSVEEPLHFKVRENVKGIGILKDKQLVCDAFFTHHQQSYFLEVDNTQAMSENKKKIALYKQCFPHIQDRNPVLLFYTKSLIRQAKLQEWCKGIRSIILTPSDIR